MLREELEQHQNTKAELDTVKRTLAQLLVHRDPEAEEAGFATSHAVDFETLDVDKDGVIDRAEFEAMALAQTPKSLRPTAPSAVPASVRVKVGFEIAEEVAAETERLSQQIGDLLQEFDQTHRFPKMRYPADGFNRGAKMTSQGSVRGSPSPVPDVVQAAMREDVEAQKRFSAGFLSDGIMQALPQGHMAELQQNVSMVQDRLQKQKDRMTVLESEHKLAMMGVILDSTAGENSHSESQLDNNTASFDQLDQNKDGVVDRNEFLAHASHHAYLESFGYQHRPLKEVGNVGNVPEDA